LATLSRVEPNVQSDSAVGELLWRSLECARTNTQDERHTVLWKVIDGLWDEGVTLYCTDHLSDRELYTLLWTDLLLEDEPIVPDDFSVTTHLDILGG